MIILHCIQYWYICRPARQDLLQGSLQAAVQDEGELWRGLWQGTAQGKVGQERRRTRRAWRSGRIVKKNNHQCQTVLSHDVSIVLVKLFQHFCTCYITGLRISYLNCCNDSVGWAMLWMDCTISFYSLCLNSSQHNKVFEFSSYHFSYLLFPSALYSIVYSIVWVII